MEATDETEVKDIFAGRELAVTVDDEAAETEVADAVAGRELTDVGAVTDAFAGKELTDAGAEVEGIATLGLTVLKLAEAVGSESEMLTWLSTARTKGRSATHCRKVIQTRMVAGGRNGTLHSLFVRFKT